MCKKLGVTALVVVAGIFVLHKLDLLGYVKTYVNKAREHVNDSISPEAKLERLKSDIKDLDEPISQQRKTIAKEMARIDTLTDDIKVAKTNLADREKKLTALRDALKKAGDEFVVVQSEQLPRKKVEAFFQRKFAEFKGAEAEVKAREELLTSRKDKVEVALQRLATMQSKQREWRAKVDKMELELAKLREAQMQHDIAVDDSKFADVAKRFEDVRTQVTSQRKELEMKTAADADTVVEKALEQEAQNKTAIEEWDARTGVKPEGDAKLTKKE